MTDRPRLLIIGASGFLGAYCVREAEHHFDVVEGNRVRRHSASEVQMDLTLPETVAPAINSAAPDLVLLLAGIADIDRCQQAPAKAFAVNARGAELVAEICAKRNARLLLASTGAVFDGKKHGYTEEDPVSPISVYGESKVQAEQAVLALNGSGVAARLPLVIGFAAHSGTNAMLNDLRNALTAGKPVNLPTFEFRNPIDAGTCAKFMLELLANPGVSGIYNLGCTESISRYDLGVRLAQRMGFANLVQPLSEPPPGRAPRGPDHFLIPGKLASVCRTSVPTCSEVIERCFHVAA